MKSLIFTAASSQYLNRTYGIPTNANIWTLALWVKRASTGGSGQFLFGTNTANEGGIVLAGSVFAGGPTNSPYLLNNEPSTTAIVKCLSAGAISDTVTWHHVNIRVDTTQSTASNRCFIEVDGIDRTDTSSTYPTQNASVGNINTNSKVHLHGVYYSANNYFLDAKLADVFFIDGTALAASNFITGTGSGTCYPKYYDIAESGLTFGTNGYRETFNNATSTATLGYDDGTGAPSSHAGSNDWTLNGMSTSNSSNDVPSSAPSSQGPYNPWLQLAPILAQFDLLGRSMSGWRKRGTGVMIPAWMQ